MIARKTTPSLPRWFYVHRRFEYALVGMTAVTGLVDAVSFLSLGHVFTANMTGNIVLLAFASTGGRMNEERMKVVDQTE